MSGYVDSWTVEQDGITYRVDLDPDTDSTPDDAECYSPSDIKAYRDDLWSYVGVTVTPLVAGAGASAATWGVEYGVMPAETEPWQGGMHDRTVIDRAVIEREYVPELIVEARAELRKLREALSALALNDCPATHVRTEGIPVPGKVYCQRAEGHITQTRHRVMEYEWGQVCQHPDYEGCPECDPGYADTPETLTWESAGHDDEPRDQNADTALVAHGYWSLGPESDGQWSVVLVEQDEHLDIVSERSWYGPSEEAVKETARKLEAREMPLITEPGSVFRVDGEELRTACGHSFATCHTDHCFRGGG